MLWNVGCVGIPPSPDEPVEVLKLKPDHEQVVTWFFSRDLEKNLQGSGKVRRDRIVKARNALLGTHRFIPIEDENRTLRHFDPATNRLLTSSLTSDTKPKISVLHFNNNRYSISLNVSATGSYDIYHIDVQEQSGTFQVKMVWIID